MLITHANIVLWGPPPRILSDHANLIVGNRIEKISPTVRLTTLDEAGIARRAGELANKAWKRHQEQCRP